MISWKIHSDIETYFITSTIVEWTPVFYDQDMFKIIIESLKFCAENKGLKIHGYVIMLNHIHLLVSSKRNLSETMRDFKTFTSTQIIKALQRNNRKGFLGILRQAAIHDSKSEKFRVWQRGFHPIGINTEKFYLQKLQYIHQNPIRKGYVIKPEHWFYSSARNYVGDNNYPLEIDIL